MNLAKKKRSVIFMSEEHLAKVQEQKRVDWIVSEIQTTIDKLSQNKEKVSSDAHEIKQNFWEDVTVNMDEKDDIEETFSSIKQRATLLSERERSKQQLEKRIDTLSRLKQSPYFGRVDFREKGDVESEAIYLGISSLMDSEEEHFLIYDWRAPISSLYYDHAPGPAKYHTPVGTIEGDMTLKRQYIIRDSKIVGMFDTGVTIGDRLLQEVLGKNADSQMKTIVATIQKEQNQIIRNEKSKYLIVQGVAGSGKTSAALQRVAYLLYRHRQTLTANNIILFSPNPLFNSYVSTVLPELGEENMQQTTFYEYLARRIGEGLAVEDSFSQLEFLLNSKETEEYRVRIESIRLKSRIDFKRELDPYIHSLGKQGIIFKNIILRHEILITAEELVKQFYLYDPAISLRNRVEMLKDWLLKELRNKKKQERSKDWVKEEAQYLEKEDFLEVFNKIQNRQKGKEVSFDDFELEERLLSEIIVNRYFKPIIVQVKKFAFIDYVKIYEAFFHAHEKKWKELSAYTIQKLEEQVIPYEDATPFCYLKDKLEGSLSSSAIRHVFIDEAQDYTPFQFSYLQELFPSSKMTLLGDMNQGIYFHTNEAHSFLPEQARAETENITLTRSYRSTKQIVEFTKHILKDGKEIEPFNREGKRPTLTIVNCEIALLKKIMDRIKEQSKSNTIAIICRIEKESMYVYKRLQSEVQVHLVSKGTITFETGILIIPSYLAKGIEFDVVLLFDTAKYQRESERRLLYTACTRAMHELHLFSMNNVSPLLEDCLDYVEINKS